MRLLAAMFPDMVGTDSPSDAVILINLPSLSYLGCGISVTALGQQLIQLLVLKTNASSVYLVISYGAHCHNSVPVP